MIEPYASHKVAVGLGYRLVMGLDPFCYERAGDMVLAGARRVAARHGYSLELPRSRTRKSSPLSTFPPGGKVKLD